MALQSHYFWKETGVYISFSRSEKVENLRYRSSHQLLVDNLWSTTEANFNNLRCSTILPDNLWSTKNVLHLNGLQDLNRKSGQLMVPP